MGFRSPPSRDDGIALMKAGRFSEAREIFEVITARDPTDWSAAYMAGQCCRYTQDMDTAVRYLETADRIAPDKPEVLLALGIAQQLSGDLQGACNSLQRAIRLDPHYVSAYNSLGLTLKKSDDLSAAIATYRRGLTALGRATVLAMVNRPDNPILPHRNTRGSRWTELAAQSAFFLGANLDAGAVMFPTGRQAEEEARTKRHRGLFWKRVETADARPAVLFLPNYFNTFQDRLRSEPVYSNLIGNVGSALEAAGESLEAEEHFLEAEEFAPQ